MVQEGKIQSSSPDICRILTKDNMTSIVANLDSLQNIRSIIRDPIVMTIDIAGLISRERSPWESFWPMWVGSNLRS